MGVKQNCLARPSFYGDDVYSNSGGVVSCSTVCPAAAADAAGADDDVSGDGGGCADVGDCFGCSCYSCACAFPSVAPSAAPVSPPSGPPSAAPTPVPTSAACGDADGGVYTYRLRMIDAGGDGWQGAEFAVASVYADDGASEDDAVASGGSGALAAGAAGVAWLCLADGCFELSVGGGTADSEIGVE